MLLTLRIENYALIEAVEIDFTAGFNVLSGETGAGKSILAGALQLVLGGRASADVVRQGASRAQVSAVFTITTEIAPLFRLLDEHEIELEDNDTLLLSRTITSDGRSKSYAGGKLVSLAVLAEIGDELVDLHGQHEHQSILKPDKQRDLLDAYGGSLVVAEELAREVRELRETTARISELETVDREAERRMEFLRHEIAEIDAAKLEPGQDEELKAQLSRASNVERIYELAAKAYARLYGAEGASAADQVHAAARAVEELATLDPALAGLPEDLAQASALLESVAETLRERGEQEALDPAEIERLNQRNVLLGTLKRKYGGSIVEILEYRSKAAAEVESFASRDEELARLRTELEKLQRAAESTAAKLSTARRKAAVKLDQAITMGLQDLAMKGARFEVELAPCALGPHGAEEVRFLLAANAGEPAKPIRQVASGGEISRIMLALKAVFAGSDRIPTLIFDEIDAGIGGAVARKVADKLRTLAQSHQVLCITHLAQIAATADSHFKISKQEVDGHAVTLAERIEGEERTEEIARLLDGSVSRESVRHAKALLKESAAA